MSQTELLHLLRSQPFRPFRIRLSNNTVYDIRHPDLALVTPSTIHVGIPSPTAADPVAQDVVIVSMRHVVQVEFLTPPADSQSQSEPTNN